MKEMDTIIMVSAITESFCSHTYLLIYLFDCGATRIASEIKSIQYPTQYPLESDTVTATAGKPQLPR